MIHARWPWPGHQRSRPPPAVRRGRPRIPLNLGLRNREARGWTGRFLSSFAQTRHTGYLVLESLTLTFAHLFQWVWPTSLMSPAVCLCSAGTFRSQLCPSPNAALSRLPLWPRSGVSLPHRRTLCDRCRYPAGPTPSRSQTRGSRRAVETAPGSPAPRTQGTRGSHGWGSVLGPCSGHVCWRRGNFGLSGSGGTEARGRLPLGALR